jgi:integrase
MGLCSGYCKTLYSLRHTHATLKLLTDGVDIHTLSEQMSTRAALMRQHFSKTIATIAAESLA